MWVKEQYMYLNRNNYEDKGNLARASVSVPDKNPKGERIYSRFFCTFFGNAYEKVSQNPDIKSFKLLQGKMQNTPYVNADGEKRYPKNPVLNIYDIDEITYNEDSATVTPF